MLLDIPIKECNVDGHINIYKIKDRVASRKALHLESYSSTFLHTFSLMRSHGPSCKRWRCSMQLLFHFPCWTWSITLNGKLAQSSLTLWSPPSLLSFVATFLFMDFPLCLDWELRQTIDPMQGARNLFSNKSSFAQNAFQSRELCPFFPITAICPVLISARASPMF